MFLSPGRASPAVPCPPAAGALGARASRPPRGSRNTAHAALSRACPAPLITQVRKLKSYSLVELFAQSKDFLSEFVSRPRPSLPPAPGQCGSPAGRQAEVVPPARTLRRGSPGLCGSPLLEHSVCVCQAALLRTSVPPSPHTLKPCAAPPPHRRRTPTTPLPWQPSEGRSRSSRRASKTRHRHTSAPTTLAAQRAARPASSTICCRQRLRRCGAAGTTAVRSWCVLWAAQPSHEPGGGLLPRRCCVATPPLPLNCKCWSLHGDIPFPRPWLCCVAVEPESHVPRFCLLLLAGSLSLQKVGRPPCPGSNATDQGAHCQAWPDRWANCELGSAGAKRGVMRRLRRCRLRRRPMRALKPPVQAFIR